MSIPPYHSAESSQHRPSYTSLAAAEAPNYVGPGIICEGPHIVIDLERIVPEDFVALHSIAERLGSHGLDRTFDAWFDRSVQPDFEEAERRRTIYAAHVTGQDPSMRSIVCYWLPSFGRHDPAYAFIVWERLLQDPDDQARSETFNLLRNHLEHECAPMEGGNGQDVVEHFGFGWPQISQLLLTYANGTRIDPSAPLPSVPLPEPHNQQ